MYEELICMFCGAVFDDDDENGVEFFVNEDMHRAACKTCIDNFFKFVDITPPNGDSYPWQ